MYPCHGINDNYCLNYLPMKEMCSVTQTDSSFQLCLLVSFSPLRFPGGRGDAEVDREESQVKDVQIYERT